MSVSFGFSVSDCIGGLKFIKEVGEALGNSCKAKDEYSSFISTIQWAEVMLHQIQELQLENISQELIQKYKAIAVNIQQAVDNFKQGIMKKFDGSLAANPVQFEKKLKTAFSKMEWTSIKSLVEEFKSSLILQFVLQLTLSQHMTMKILDKDRCSQAHNICCQFSYQRNQGALQSDCTSISSRPAIECDSTSHFISTVEEIPKTSDVSEEIMAEENTLCLSNRSDGKNNSTTANFTCTSPCFSHYFGADSSLPVLRHPSTSSADLQVQGDARFTGLPIKSPTDGSIRIYSKPSYPDHGVKPIFVIPGRKDKSLPLKDPCDGSIKSLEMTAKSTKHSTYNKPYRRNSIFASPQGKKTVIRDPSNMAIIDFDSRKLS